MNLPTCLTLVCGIATLLPGALMGQSATPEKNTSATQSADAELPAGGPEHNTPSSSSDTSGPDAAELEKLAKETANPLGAAWMLWFQNDYTHMDGDNDALPSNGRWANSTKFQPVMSFPYDVGDDEWNLIVRPVVQYQSSPLDDSFGDALQGRTGDIPTNKLLGHNYPYSDRTTGFGDTGLLTLTGPARAMAWSGAQVLPSYSRRLKRMFWAKANTRRDRRYYWPRWRQTQVVGTLVYWLSIGGHTPVMRIGMTPASRTFNTF
ncbi:hypothetical protein [Pseudomonas sp.]|uniref:hypothetical protein n=1 Tax=Pseudomonas sp. TaxID=306 RepID=UPI003A96F4C3